MTRSAGAFSAPRIVRALALLLAGLTCLAQTSIGASPSPDGSRSTELAGGPSPVVTLAESPASGDWVLVVNSTHDPKLPGHGQEFVPLARSIPRWKNLGAKQVWVAHLTPKQVESEPRPLAIFFSGSFKDWCEVDRRHWRGAEKILKRGRIPIWASCGGAQALAILAETGTRKPWDCPHCRDPLRPRLPIYTHIGHKTPGPHRCGDYSECIFERGPHQVRQIGSDPVFAGLPDTFEVMESHCGQIEFPPAGWRPIATAGEGTQTRNQCLRWGDRPIYAAQFHIEMAGTPETSRTILSNFLTLAERWNQTARR